MIVRPTESDGYAALKRWGIADGGTVRHVLGRTMNDTFAVTRANGSYVLRCHRHTDRALIEIEHHVMSHVAARKIPVASIVPADDGESIVATDGRWWSLSTWLVGDRIARADLRSTHARTMGQMLARVHNALDDFTAPDPMPPVKEPIGETRRRIDDIVAHITTLDAHGEDERVALAWLHDQSAWLADQNDAISPSAAGPAQMIHGDYHDANVLFDDTQVVGVLDWDNAGSGHPAEEVLRAMHLSFGLESERCGAFVAGYRTARDLSIDQLDRAATSYGFARDRSVWFFDELYRKGNERLRPLINRRPFVPFELLWEPTRGELAAL